MRAAPYALPAVSHFAHDGNILVERAEPVISGLLSDIRTLFSRFFELHRNPADYRSTCFPRGLVNVLQDLCIVQELLLEEYRRSGSCPAQNQPPPLDPEAFRSDAIQMLTRITGRLHETGSLRIIEIDASPKTATITNRS